MSLLVYVEGGGDRRSYTACRKAFGAFFGRVLGDRPKARIVACGARHQAYEDFRRSLKDDPKIFAVLLVDSENPVMEGVDAATHLRKQDDWTDLQPGQSIHLMVQCMESWFLADKRALSTYYGDGFREQTLPANPRIEQIPKGDVLSGLRIATRGTRIGSYHKTRHAFDILERIDPEMVKKASPFAERLFRALLEG